MIVLVAAAAVITSVAMAVVWAVSVRITNAGIVDVAWSAMFSVVAAFYAAAAEGAPLRRALIAAMVILWSLRLATHLGRRVLSHLDREDTRYAQLRQDWGEAADRKMFWFFQLQGGTIVLLSIPIVIATSNPASEIAPLEWAATALWALALAGESVADAQLRRFARDPGNRGGVMDRGLWRYSRHPNYFFEWLIWCAFALFALASPFGWVGLVAPLLMWTFLYRVTGIPATEAQSLRNRGEAYRRYQARTSAFIPWFPRDERAGEAAGRSIH